LSIANQNEEFTLLDLKAEYLLKDKKFIEAVSIFNLLIENDPEVNYLKRAICFEKLHKRQEVVNDLKKAIALGNEEASLLYDKINPIKKKIAYYVTRCCDGSTSNAKGRGACSHHDGVCNWNDPVYTEYRDY
jgi:tetratricopeptide (TPR) repeat protein